MSFIKLLRLNSISKKPFLTDIRMMKLDGLDLPIEILKKMEQDENYCAHANVYIKIADYHSSYEVLANTCQRCLLNNNKTILKINSSLNNSSEIYEVEHLSDAFKKARSNYKNSSKSKIINRRYLHDSTGIPTFTLKEIESNKTYFPYFQDSKLLIDLYKDYRLLLTVCKFCPINEEMKRQAPRKPTEKYSSGEQPKGGIDE